LSRHPPCSHFLELQHVVDDVVSWTMTDVQHDAHLVHHNATVFPDDTFNLLNCLQRYDSVGLARSRSICHSRHAILKLPTPFIHLLQR
jgi:hypothetical protein